MDRYPYTNFHELNLVYFLKHFKEIFQQWDSLYQEMLSWKDATIEELETWKNGVVADIEAWEAALLGEVGDWEDDLMASLEAWKTAFETLFDSTFSNLEDIKTDAEAARDAAIAAQEAAEAAQAAAEAAAETLELDATLTSATKAAQAKAVGDYIFDGNSHTGRTPTILSFVDTSSYSSSNQYDIANLPFNSQIFIAAGSLTNAFETGGIFQGCPVSFNAADVLRIERHIQRPDYPNASLYVINAIRTHLFCWRTSAGVNYWIKTPMTLDSTLSIAGEPADALAVGEALSEKLSTADIDTTLTLQGAAADAETVGTILYGSTTHTRITPTVTRYYNVSASTSNPFDISTLPMNTYVFMPVNYMTNAFETGGFLEGCPISTPASQYIRVERISMRSPAQSGSLFIVQTQYNMAYMWSSDSGNYWYGSATTNHNSVTSATNYPNGYSLTQDLKPNSSVYIRYDVIGPVVVAEFTGVPETSNQILYENNIPGNVIAIRKYSDSSIVYEGGTPSSEYYYITRFSRRTGSTYYSYWTAYNPYTKAAWIGYKLSDEPQITWKQIAAQSDKIKIAMLGDSITYGTTNEGAVGSGHYSFLGYPYWVDRYCGDIFKVSYKNIAWSGTGWLSTMSTNIRPEGTVPNAKTIVAGINWNEYDVLTICLGYNDTGYTLGTIDDAPSSNTVGGAINYVLDYVHNDSTNGNEKLNVVLMTIPYNKTDPSSNKGIACTAIDTLIKAAAEKYHIPVIDMSRWCSSYNLDSLISTGDNPHPNLAGYKRMGQYVSGQLKSIICG